MLKAHARLVWISVIALGWLLDFLFWKQAPGVNFALYAALCLIAGFFLLRLDGVGISSRSAWLLPFIAFFAVITFIRAEPLTMSLAVVIALFLMAVLAITFAGGRWLEYNLTDYALGLLRLAWSVMSRPFAFRGQAGPTSGRTGAQSPWPIVRGILLALPILLLFAALLGSADLVFQRQLDDLIRLLSLERLPEYIFRLVYILVAAFALLGVFLHAAESRDEHLAGREPSASRRFLGLTEASIVLASVAILFLAFVTVQFRYFFGGQANINLEGFTYSEYARRGFGELLAVAFFSLLMILGLGAVTRRDSVGQQRLFSALSTLIVLLVGVMLVSAYLRLGLYEGAYGFSRLRTYTHVCLIWLGLLLAAVVVLELLHRERWFAAAALLASLGFAATLSLLNVDAFIARQNVARAVGGQELDVPHLASLSTDSVPTLASIFGSGSTPLETREAVGAALACRLNRAQPRSPMDWRSFTFSRWYAGRAMDAVRPQLGGYRFVDDEMPAQVITPQGTAFDCYVYGD